MPRALHQEAKICIVGDAGVGKTSLVRRYVGEEFDERCAPTQGTRLCAVELGIPHSQDLAVTLTLNIQDIVGQQGFMRMIRETFFHGIQGLIAVCDLRVPESVTNLHEWILTARETPGRWTLLIAANKSDLKSRASQDELERLSQMYDCPVLLTSAKTGSGVDELFELIASSIVQSMMVDEDQKATHGDLYGRILELAVERHPDTVPKTLFFESIKGVGYDSLEENVTRLEADGLVEVRWMGPGDFSVVATEAGRLAVQS